MDHLQEKVIWARLQVIWQVHRRVIQWDHHQKVIWDLHQVIQWDLLQEKVGLHQEIWQGLHQVIQWDLHQKVIWDHHQVIQWDHRQEIWQDHHQEIQWDHRQEKWQGLHQVIWDHRQVIQWDLHQKVIWQDQDQTDQLSDLMENQWDLQWDLHLIQKVVLDQGQMDLLQVEKVQIHYLVTQDQQVDHRQEICLQVIRWVNQDQWMADQVIRWDLHRMIWVVCILIWMMQQLMDLKIQDQEHQIQWPVIWMVMV
jgi:hypothetical protein